MRISILKDTGAEDGAWEFIKHYLDSGVKQWETIYVQTQLSYATLRLPPDVERGGKDV